MAYLTTPCSRVSELIHSDAVDFIGNAQNNGIIEIGNTPAGRIDV